MDLITQRLEEEKNKTALLKQQIQQVASYRKGIHRGNTNATINHQLNVGENDSAQNAKHSLASSLLYSHHKHKREHDNEHVYNNTYDPYNVTMLMRESLNERLSSANTNTSYSHTERMAWDVLSPSSIQHECGNNAVLSNILYWHGEHANTFPISDFSSSIAEALWKTLPPFEAHVADLCIQALSRLEAYSVRKKQLSSGVRDGGPTDKDTSDKQETVSNEVVTEVFLHVRIDPTTGYPIVTDSYDSQSTPSWASSKQSNYNTQSEVQQLDQSEACFEFVSFEVWFVAKPTLGVQCAGQIKLPFDSQRKAFVNCVHGTSHKDPSAWSFTVNGPKRLGNDNEQLSASKKPFYPRIADTYLVASPKMTESFVPYTEAWKRAVQATRARMQTSKGTLSSDHPVDSPNYQYFQQQSHYPFANHSDISYFGTAFPEEADEDPHQFGILRQSHSLGFNLDYGYPNASKSSGTQQEQQLEQQIHPEAVERATGAKLLNALSGSASRRLSIGGAYAQTTNNIKISPLEGLDDIRKSIKAQNHRIRTRNPLPPPQPPPQPEPPSPKISSSAASTSSSSSSPSSSSSSIAQTNNQASESEEESEFITDCEINDTFSPNYENISHKISSSGNSNTSIRDRPPQTPAYPGQTAEIASATTPWGWLISPALSQNTPIAQNGMESILNAIPPNVRDTIMNRNSPMLTKANEIPLHAASSALRTYLISSKFDGQPDVGQGGAAGGNEHINPIDSVNQNEHSLTVMKDCEHSQSFQKTFTSVNTNALPSEPMGADASANTNIRSKTPPRSKNTTNAPHFISYSTATSAASNTSASEVASNLYSPLVSVVPQLQQQQGLTSSTQSHMHILQAQERQNGSITSTSKSISNSPISLINSAGSDLKLSNDDMDQFREHMNSGADGTFFKGKNILGVVDKEPLSKKSLEVSFPITLRVKLLASLWRSFALKLRKRKVKRAARLMNKIKRMSERSPSSSTSAAVHSNCKNDSSQIVNTVKIKSSQDDIKGDSDHSQEATSVSCISSRLSTEELKAYLPSEPLPHLNYCFRHKLVHEMRIMELINCVLRGYQHLISTNL